MNVAIYCKVGGSEPDPTGTLDAQARTCRDWAESRGYTIVAEYRDRGPDRRARDQLAADAEAGGFADAVVAIDLSRYGRRTTELLAFVDELEARGVQVTTVDASDPGHS